MRPSRPAALLLAAATALAPDVARAQDDGDFAAYFASIITPVGALPARVHGADARTAPGSVDLRYGRLAYESDDVSNNFALGFSGPVRAGRVGATVGAVTHEGQDAILLFGVDFEASLATSAVGEGTWGVGLLPAFGFAVPTGDEDEGNALSLSAGLPLTYTAGSDWRITAHLTPTLAFGRISGEGESESGVRPLVGLGLSARGPMGWGFMAGYQKVILEGAEPVLGVGFSFGAGGAR